MSDWLALIVAAPFCTASFDVSTAKVSAPILIVATPFFTSDTWPMVAPVLSFTDMPLLTMALAPTLAAAFEPDAEAAPAPEPEPEAEDVGGVVPGGGASVGEGGDAVGGGEV